MPTNAQSVRLAIAAVIAGASCRSTPAPQPEPGPGGAVVPASPDHRPLVAKGDLVFILVAHGPDGQQRFVEGTNSCCDELRSGWMVWRSQTWLAGDTLAQRRRLPTGAVEVRKEGPFFTQVDSGRLARRLQGNQYGDTALFLGVRDGVLPMAGAVGVLRHDTLFVRAVVSPDLAKFEWAETRIYVRVRP